MYRTAASRLRALKGHAGNLGAARYATSSAVASRSSSGLFSWLGGSKLPPLNIPLEGISLPPPLDDHVEPSKLEITTLPNGVKIASEASKNPAASIGLYIDCGSIYETPLSCGATHLLERMAFKSTRNRSHLRVVREVEAIGGNTSASASREQMGYTFDALKTYVPEMVELLIDSVRNPVFLDWEVNEELRKVKGELAEIHNNPQGLLLEAIHSAGYAGALANPLFAPESALNRLDATILEEFVSENYTAPRMVLAASGVDHGELLQVAEPLLSDLPQVSHAEEPKSVYVGGDYRRQADSESTHIALAFEVPGGWHNEKEAIVLTVLQMLMGGGGSFSAGGPGKGMHSRLYVRSDLRRLADFYKEIFGFEEIESPNFGEFKVIWLNLPGAFAMHLIERNPLTKLPEGPYSATSPVLYPSHLPRGHHICFSVSNFDSFLQSLKDKGIETFQRSRPDGKVRQVFFFDPDGNGLEVAGPVVP